MLTKAQYDAIKDRVQKTSSGPWNTVKLENQHFVYSTPGIASGSVTICESIPGLPEEQSALDFDFIANARMDMEALLKTIEWMFQEDVDFEDPDVDEEDEL